VGQLDNSGDTHTITKNKLSQAYQGTHKVEQHSKAVNCNCNANGLVEVCRRSEIMGDSRSLANSGDAPL